MKHISKLLILILVIVLGWQFLVPKDELEAPVVEDIPAGVISVSVDYGDGEIVLYGIQELDLSDRSAYKALADLGSTRGLEIGSKDFGGELGMFVESINGVSGTDGEWWQFWVNDNYSTVGASSYLLEPGDAILWRLTGDQEGGADE